MGKNREKKEDVIPYKLAAELISYLYLLDSQEER
jgi:hypothetical protein